MTATTICSVVDLPCRPPGSPNYIVYHQHNQPHEDAGGVFRQACADRLEFNADGTIKEVVPTQTGVGALLPLAEPGEDLAFGKYARATSVRNGFYSPEYALDRNNASKWCAATNAAYPQTLTVDLDGTFDIGRVETSFEYPTLAYQYAIETSIDGKTWTMFADRTGATPPAVSPHRDSGTAKAAFVRITVTGCERPENAAGIYSFKVFRAAGHAGASTGAAYKGLTCDRSYQPLPVTLDLPENRGLKNGAYEDERSRGLGGMPCGSCGEENLLNLPGDPYGPKGKNDPGENITIHEFAHTIADAIEAVRSRFPVFDFQKSPRIIAAAQRKSKSNASN